MPNIKSAIKRVELTRKRTERNKAIKSRVKTAIKKFRLALEQGDASTAEKLRQAIRTLDKAVTKGVIHPNTAARKKSRLQRLFNKTSASA
ncbi:MAG: 30S ribosomal protein S20 [Moorella humiferrea]|uniref:Small ribosomal subunit protein bS20 n=1 Tax=Neomoorella humiferrea TaxID=676965 RepID=A0A2T0AW59_9FIRM|nr:30S ribosomal protein S20 [Moorella humiferrea]MBE3573201.1 30S ribosomal protein S20 [Moorella humiferrea]PRR74941.1 30S ribosomal protein S20 [Moorella humiferrea]